MQFSLSKNRRTNYARIIAELSNENLRLRRALAGVCLLPYLLKQRLRQIFTLVAYAAAYGEYVRLEYVDNVRNTARKIADVFVNNLCRNLVPCLHSSESCARGYLREISADHFFHGCLASCLASFRDVVLCDVYKTCSGAVRLPAAVSTACAGTTALFDNGVTKLSAREVESGVNLAVDDDAAAQPRAECDHNGILSSLSNARESLSLSSSVSVVFDIHLLAVEESGELSGDGVVSEGDVV